MHESHVAESLRFGEFPGALDHRRGDVHAQCTTGLCQARCVARRLSGAAPDIKDMVAGMNAPGTTQHLVVALKFGIVINAANARHAFSL